MKANTEKPTATWAERIEVIASLASALERALAAHARGDRTGLREELDFSRDERARFQRMRSITREDAPTGSKEVAAMREVGRHVARVRVADEELARCIGFRDGAEDGVAAGGSDESLQDIIDTVIPPAWDRKRDLVVLFGGANHRFASLFAERGYERVVFVRWRDEDAALELPVGVPSLQGTEDIEGYLSGVYENPPFQVRFFLPKDATQEHQELKETILTYVRRMITGKSTAQIFGSTWSINSIKNIPALVSARQMISTRGVFEGIPCVLVCPGPSLQKNIDVLKALQGKAIIFAVSHALESLEKNGIRAQFTAAIDPQPILKSHFERGEVTKLLGAVLGATVDPEIYQMPIPRIYPISCNGHNESWLYEYGINLPMFQTGGTVAHTALLAALSWGCSPILLTGQDLAFTNNQIYHEDTQENRKAAEEKNGVGVDPTSGSPLVKVKDHDGNDIYTNIQFHSYRLWYEGLMANDPSLPILNCTEGGARIEGMPHIPLAEASRDFGPLPDLQPRLDGADPARDVAAALRQALEVMVKRDSRLADALRCVKRCAGWTERMAKGEPVAGSLDAAEQELREKVREIPELSIHLTREIRKVDENIKDLRQLNQAVFMTARLHERVQQSIKLLQLEYERAREQTREALAGLGG